MSNFDWGVIARSWPFLAEGMALSALLVAVATAGGLVLGFALALMRLSSRPLIAAPARRLRDADALGAVGAGSVLVLFPGSTGDRPADRLAGLGR